MMAQYRNGLERIETDMYFGGREEGHGDQRVEYVGY